MDKSKALTWTELRVGVVVILSLVVLAFTILYIGGGGGSPLAPKYTVKALMSDVNGLKTGAPVRVGGVEVGTVAGVDFANGGAGLVEVVMRLDRRIQTRVTTESQATLGSMGLLGEKAVDISAATRGTPLDDGGYLSAAGEDPMKGLLNDASDSMQHFRRILARVDAGQGLIGKTLRDEELYERMVDVSVRLQRVMDKFESSDGPLGRLVNDREMSTRLSDSVRGIDAVVGRIEAGKGTLGVLTHDEQLGHDLRDLTAQLSEISQRIRKGEGSLGRLVQDDSLYKRVDATAGRLEAILDTVEGGEGSAGRLLKDPELYNNLNGALTDFRTLVSDVRRDPRKYLRVKVSLF